MKKRTLQTIDTNQLANVSGGGWGELVGYTAGGALVGAGVGSVVPGLGTVGGAAVGGLAGLSYGVWREADRATDQFFDALSDW